ncbi:2-oxoacid:acceptor oxidoreductase subunit alpha [Halochromatium salexigens]|uniref:2-oxoacid:acceptor oxidoreductase subunit alpha n=1 Tax=Halochromatium salexigens TaxID=49447 RepID=UPI0030B85ACE
MTAHSSAHQHRQPEPITVAVCGSGGSGAVTAGLILLAAARRCGYYGLLMRAAGPQVRGGESVSILRFGTHPIGCIGDRVDLLAALDWRNIERFVDELPLTQEGLILTDPASGPVPDAISASGATQCKISFSGSAREHPGGRANMVAVGTLAREARLGLDALLAGAEETLAKKSQFVIDAAHACIRAGYEAASPTAGQSTINQPAARDQGETPRWQLSGNAAAGLGALRAGVRFVAAYPITPASEMLEWLAPRIERLGGTLVQAEDELAAVNMLVGASFGGIPALTATSGPGLSLMSEGIGLAIASETPILVVNVARGGPSTGLPTKSEQADLDQALYGLHGDAPHLVLAPISIADCSFSVEWASRLAERLQTAAILLSDQMLGQTQATIDPPPPCSPVPERKRIEAQGIGDIGGDAGATGAKAPPQVPQQTPADTACARYALTPDGISPMPIPGQPGYTYTADGLEHDPCGTPSSRASDHALQLAKRRDKLLAYDYGAAWAEIDHGGQQDTPQLGPASSSSTNSEPPRLTLLTWGSSWGAVQEAATRLRADGISVRAIALRLIAPLQRAALRSTLGSDPVLVVELNHSGQLFGYLHAERSLPAGAQSLARPGPLPLRPAEIIAAAQQTLLSDPK